MNKRFLMMLGAAAIVILVSALCAVYYQKSNEGSLSEGDNVLLGLSEQLANVERIQFTTATTEPYSVDRTEAGWVVKQRHQYPADFSKIRALLDQLSSAKFYEPKTSDPDHYAVLGVADITDKNSSGVLVDVFVKNKSEPYRLIVGKLATTWDGSYARLPGQTQSWLLDRQIPVNGLITAWLNSAVLGIQPERVYKVTYTTPQKQSLIVVRKIPNAKQFIVQNLSGGKALRYDTVADGVPHDFANIILRDVAPLSAHSFTSVNTYHIELQTYDGLVVDIQTEKAEGRFFVTLQAKFDANAAQSFGVTDSALIDKVKAEADALQKRATGWVYEVNEHVYVDLTKTMKDVLLEVGQPANKAVENTVEEEHDH